MKIKNEKKIESIKLSGILPARIGIIEHKRFFFTTVIKAFGKLDQLPIGDSHSRQDEFQPELLGFFFFRGSCHCRRCRVCIDLESYGGDRRALSLFPFLL